VDGDRDSAALGAVVPSGKYRTIVADPPWHYDHSGATFRGAQGGTYLTHRLPYPTMTVNQIAALPVGSLAEDDAHLYLWTTQKYLRDAYAVTEAWGFRPSSVLVWCKAPRGFIMGNDFSSTVEFVLFCRRGSLPTLRKVDRNWWRWPRGAHSAKPEAFIDLVEQVSPPPYVELFARRHRLGWDVWGLESANTAQLGDAV